MEVSLDRGRIAQLAGRRLTLWALSTGILAIEIDSNVRRNLIHCVTVISLRPDIEGASNDILRRIFEPLDQYHHLTWIRFGKLHSIVECKRLLLSICIAS